MGARTGLLRSCTCPRGRSAARQTPGVAIAGIAYRAVTPVAAHAGRTRRVSVSCHQTPVSLSVRSLEGAEESGGVGGSGRAAPWRFGVRGQAAQQHPLCPAVLRKQKRGHLRMIEYRGTGSCSCGPCATRLLREGRTRWRMRKGKKRGKFPGWLPPRSAELHLRLWAG